MTEKHSWKSFFHLDILLFLEKKIKTFPDIFLLWKLTRHLVTDKFFQPKIHIHYNSGVVEYIFQTFCVIFGRFVKNFVLYSALVIIFFPKWSFLNVSVIKGLGSYFCSLSFKTASQTEILWIWSLIKSTTPFVPFW